MSEDKRIMLEFLLWVVAITFAIMFLSAPTIKVLMWWWKFWSL